MIKPKQQLRVYDPDQPDKIFIIREGKVIDVTDEDTKNEAEKGNDTPEDGLSNVILRAFSDCAKALWTKYVKQFIFIYLN